MFIIKLAKFFQTVFNFSKNKDVVSFKNITPTDPEQRGSQLSLQFSSNTSLVHEELEKRGVIVRINFF